MDQDLHEILAILKTRGLTAAQEEKILREIEYQGTHEIPEQSLVTDPASMKKVQGNAAGFYAHHDLTHTTLLGFAVAFTFLVFLLLHRRRSLPLYALLGCTLALGFYAKYNYIVFPISLTLAALTLREFRPLVLDRRVLVTAGLAMLAVTPYVVWVFSQDHSLIDTGRTIVRGEQGNLFLVHARGLGAVAVAVVEFTLPFGIIALVFVLV